MLKGTRSRVPLAVLAALAVVAAGLTAVPARAAVGQVRAAADSPLQPTANPAPNRGKTGPGLAVNPANVNHIVEIHHDVASQECEFNVSTDGGTTWTGGVLEPPAGFPPNACPRIDNGGLSIGQQSVAFGSVNRVYVTWSSPATGTDGYSVLLSTSTNGGASFGAAAVVMPGGGAPSPSFADPELVVDRRSESAGDDRVYVSARDIRTSRAMVARSDSSGTTFSAAVEASDTSAAAPVWNGAGTAVVTPGNAFTRATELAQPVLGPAPAGGGDRPLYLAWLASRNDGACPPSCERLGETPADGYLVVANSADLGQSWSRTRAVNVRGAILLTGTAYGAGSIFPRLVADGSGDLYMAFNQGPGVGGSNSCGAGPYPGTLGGPTRTCAAYGPFSPADSALNWDTDAYFIRSIDGGSVWGDLKKVNEDKKPGLAVPEVIQTRHPQIFVAPDGRIDLVWQDRRHWYLNTSDRKATPSSVSPNPTNADNFGCLHAESNCPEARLADIYYARSRDRGVSFTANRRLSDRSRNLEIGYPHRVGTPRDHGPAIAHLGTEGLLVADVDSRRGRAADSTGIGADNSQDVFLRRLSLNAGGGPLPVQDAGTGTAPPLSVALSQRTYPAGPEPVPGPRSFGPRPWTRPVIVNEADMPSALAGGVLARANLGPVLASPQAGLPTAVQAEVTRLGPQGVYILGDATKLSSTIEAQLVAAGVPAVQIVRITGATPAEMAANIALILDRRRAVDKTTTPPLPAFDAVVIANPNSASASAASALAANRRLPVLYVDQSSVPAATSNAIMQLNVTKALIVGGDGAVSDRVLNAPARTITGSTITGSPALTTTASAFTADDVGRGISGPGLPAGTTIVSVPSPISATLSSSATSTGTGTFVIAARTNGLPVSQVTRLGTGNQYSASDAVLSESLARGLPKNNVYVADGNEPMHAALLGAAAARTGGLLTLAPGGTAAAAESTINALGLCAVVDRLVLSNLTGSALVANDPGGPGATAGPCPTPPLEPLPETSPESTFAPVSPARVWDTRGGPGPVGRVGAGQTRDVTVTGIGGVPATGVSAVVLNVTAVAPSSGTFVTVWPAGQPRPLASNLNVPAGDTRPNLVTVKVGAGGKVSFFNATGTLDLLADVAGWYGPTGGQRYTPVSPARVWDTRGGPGPVGRVGAGQTRDVTVTGVGGVPASGVSAVVLNVTAVSPTAGTFVTAFPAGEARPNASNLNVPPGDTRPNLVIVKVGAGGQVTVYNDAGTVDLIADVAGWFGAPSP